MEHWIIYGSDITGTIIFAITGAIRGIQIKLDFLGVIVFACSVGVGGGMLRDMLIGSTPVVAFTNPVYLLSCIVTGVTVFFLYPKVTHMNSIILFCDAAGLGVFTALGAAKGLSAGLADIGVILSGVLTAVGGGVIRDVLARQIPVVLSSDFYATASLLGGILYCFLAWMELPMFDTFLAVFCFVTGIRILAILLKLRLPVANPNE